MRNFGDFITWVLLSVVWTLTIIHLIDMNFHVAVIHNLAIVVNMRKMHFYIDNFTGYAFDLIDVVLLFFFTRWFYQSQAKA